MKFDDVSNLDNKDINICIDIGGSATAFTLID